MEGRYEITGDDYSELNAHLYTNRGRTGRSSLLTAYMLLLGEPQVSSPQSRRQSSQPPLTQPSPQPAAVDPRLEEQTISYGLLNVFRRPNATPVVREAEASATLRFNMINLYIKFVIQALLYLLAAYLLYVILQACFQMPLIILIPLILVSALHLAARNMHRSEHALLNEEGYNDHSLSGPFDVLANTCVLIDRAANYGVGFFSAYARRLADSTILDNQITYVPNGFTT